jgi:hypothetical protein
MEAQERVLKIEAEGTTSLEFVHGEADKFARMVALLEGELAGGRRAWDMTDENF